MNRALGVMLKNPIKGLVKTRLAATMGSEKALSVYLTLLQKLAQTVRNTQDVQTYFFHSPEVLDNEDWVPSGVQHKLQTEGDLGDRMRAAMEVILTTHSNALLIGADCPAINSALLHKAFQSLSYADLCLGPTEDGGYYLIGMKKLHQGMFKDIEWSTERVWDQSIDAAARQHLSYALLPELFDIDYEQDWNRWQQQNQSH